MSPSYRDAAAVSGPGRTALLLVNLGTPDAPTRTAVRRYLAEFLHDPRVVELSRWLWCPLLHFGILPLRSGRVARNYAKVWMPEGSPLLVHTRRLGRALQHALPDLRVAVAMRYGNPSLPDTLRGLEAEGVTKLLVLPLYPQYSASTTASVFDAVSAELQRWRRVPELRFVADYHDDVEWLDALEARIRGHWDLHGRGAHLLLSFHGLPQRFERAGDPYPRQCEAGARALAQRLELAPGDWSLTYQSRFGREAWLEPATDRRLVELAHSGIDSVDVICPGFAVDCLETLEEIAIQNAERYRAAGGAELRYVSALNEEPGHVAALAAIARRHLQGWS
jgi:ferrochelatase